VTAAQDMGNSIVILCRFSVFRFVLGLAVVGAVGLSCAGGDGGASTETASTEATSTVVAVSVPPHVGQLLDGPGPNHVGFSTITITDVTRNRPLTVYVWFPVDDPGAAPPVVYEVAHDAPFPSSTAVTAAPTSISGKGPFPLVVISHGSEGAGVHYAGYAEMMASYGYVVAATNHTGNSNLDPEGVETSRPQSLLDRPRDVTAIITEMLSASNKQTATFAANIDPNKIAVLGHSRGGLTAFEVAAGVSNDLGEYQADPRVKAIVALAPGADPADITDGRLAAIKVPTMLIVGTNDNVAPIEPHIRRPWELVSGRPLYRIELVDGKHLSFSDFCHYLDYWGSASSVPFGVRRGMRVAADGACDPGAMPIARADALTNTFMIRFLDSVFKGGAPLESTFIPVPDDVTFMSRR
jgi:predicted dienelactone hydrolase